MVSQVYASMLQIILVDGKIQLQEIERNLG